MSKRTKLKLRNIRMYLAKYVFNGRYIVRNILVATIMMTFVALVSGAVLVIDDAQKDKAEAKMVAKEQVKEQNVSIYVYEVSSVDSDSISTLKADLEVKTETVVEANKTQMVAESTSEFDARCVAKTDNINVRKESNTDSDIVGTMNNGAVADIVATEGEWFKIKSGDISGYVKKEFVLTGKDAEKYAKKYYTSTGTVNVDGVYVRATTSKEAEIIETAYVGTTYDVDMTQSTDEWVCVSLEDGTNGYVYAEFITVKEGYPTAILADYKEDKKSDEEVDDTTESEDASEDEEATDNKQEEEEEPTTEQPQPEQEEPTTEEPKEETKEEPKEETKEEPTTEEPKQDNGNQVTIETTNRGAIALSDADINLMASIMTLECGGEPYEGQLAVANVILNRLQSGYYGSTISDVVYAPYQFSVTSSPMLDYYIQNGAQASCIQAAREAASGVNNIGSFTCFRPTWNIDTSTLGVYTIIGNHVFY